MGLLDSMPATAEAYKAQFDAATDQMTAYFDRHPGTPAEQAIRAQLQSGLTAGTVLGLTKAHRDVILKQGLTALQVRDVATAREWLMFALTLDPLEERAMYGLGVIAQGEGDLTSAARYFVHFLALDATNPQGFLRLGECFLANDEIEEAQAAFQAAVDLGEAGHGGASALAHARRMLAVCTPAA